jgi:hypothetical protein
VTIREIRQLLIAEGERRQRLGLLALDRQLDGRSSRLDVSQAPSEEPKALEEGRRLCGGSVFVASLSRPP